MTPFQIVVAVSKNRGIGYHHELPWNIPKEIGYFKELTQRTVDPSKQNAVIMGRNTWNSIPVRFRPLDKRINIVITSTPQTLPLHEYPDRLFSFPTLTKALEFLTTWKPVETAFVIGGETLYKEAVRSPHCHAIHYTVIQREYPCDAFFPSMPWGQWTLQSVEIVQSDPTFQICVFTRSDVSDVVLPPATRLISKELIEDWTKHRENVHKKHRAWIENSKELLSEKTTLLYNDYEDAISCLQTFERLHNLCAIS